MRSIFALSSLIVLAFGSTAMADRPVVDCGKAGRGQVTITVRNARMNHERAAEVAFVCLREKNASVLKARLEALKAAKTETDSEGCGTVEKLQIITQNSWISDRIDAYGESGGDSTQIVREPLSCSGIGTGLFGGIVASSSFTVKVTETYKMDPKKSASRQVMIVTLENPVEIVKKTSVSPNSAPAFVSTAE